MNKKNENRMVDGKIGIEPHEVIPKRPVLLGIALGMN
jgi:hypothetical protein